MIKSKSKKSQVELFCFELEAPHWEVLQEELGKPEGRIGMLTLASIEGVHEETIGPIARTAAAVPEVHFQVASNRWLTTCRQRRIEAQPVFQRDFLFVGAQLPDYRALGCDCC